VAPFSQRVPRGNFGVILHLKFITQQQGVTLWAKVAFKSGVRRSLNVFVLKPAAPNELRFCSRWKPSRIEKRGRPVLTEHGSVLKKSGPHTHTHTQTQNMAVFWRRVAHTHTHKHRTWQCSEEEWHTHTHSHTHSLTHTVTHTHSRTLTFTHTHTHTHSQ
jgi:hypothetical protein